MYLDKFVFIKCIVHTKLLYGGGSEFKYDIFDTL
jgi:hypothetical protein